MREFCTFKDIETRESLRYWLKDDFSEDGLIPEVPVSIKNFDPKDDYDIYDLFYHEDLKKLMNFEWHDGDLFLAVARQLCNSFYFSLFMDTEKTKLPDNKWIELSYFKPAGRVFIPAGTVLPKPSERFGYFPVKDYLTPSGHPLYPFRMNVQEIFKLIQSKIPAK